MIGLRYMSFGKHIFHNTITIRNMFSVLLNIKWSINFSFVFLQTYFYGALEDAEYSFAYCLYETDMVSIYFSYIYIYSIFLTLLLKLHKFQSEVFCLF